MYFAAFDCMQRSFLKAIVNRLQKIMGYELLVIDNTRALSSFNSLPKFCLIYMGADFLTAPNATAADTNINMIGLTGSIVCSLHYEFTESYPEQEQAIWEDISLTDQEKERAIYSLREYLLEKEKIKFAACVETIIRFNQVLGNLSISFSDDDLQIYERAELPFLGRDFDTVLKSYTITPFDLSDVYNSVEIKLNISIQRSKSDLISEFNNKQ